jgi:hypothetical protein
MAYLIASTQGQVESTRHCSLWECASRFSDLRIKHFERQQRGALTRTRRALGRFCTHPRLLPHGGRTAEPLFNV